MTRGNCVWRMPLFPDGSIGKAGQFFTSYGPSGPDGLAMDEAGRLIVCNPGLGCGLGAERARRAGGDPAQRGGRFADQRRVRRAGAQDRYFTESVTGTILRAQMSAPGCAMHVGRGATQ